MTHPFLSGLVIGFVAGFIVTYLGVLWWLSAMEGD